MTDCSPISTSCFRDYKGYQALQRQRISHWLWKRPSRDFADFLQNRWSEVFAVDIHPAVPIGRGVFIDHGTGVAIGETAVPGLSMDQSLPEPDCDI